MECDGNLNNDPWCSHSELIRGIENYTHDFEDNFLTLTRDVRERLPDSAEYLASLEKKLARIKSGKSNKKTEGKELIKSLEESTDSCMYRLIADNSLAVTSEDLLLETPTKLSLSSKWVKPEQALTVGELVELVKADYLAQNKEEIDKTENTDGKPSSI